jgi:uncharacterized protein YidB (DUF937 family)
MARGYPSMTALLGVLAVLGYQNRDKIAEVLGKLGKPGDPNQKEQGGLGGLLGQLSGSLGGASAGGVLSGGIGELVDRFREKGLGDTADSWVGTGANKELEPKQLEQAIGPEVLDTLAEQTGLSRDELLDRLTRELPKAVDKFTPQGRVPTESEMARSVDA